MIIGHDTNSHEIILDDQGTAHPWASVIRDVVVRIYFDNAIVQMVPLAVGPRFW